MNEGDERSPYFRKNKLIDRGALKGYTKIPTVTVNRGKGRGNYGNMGKRKTITNVYGQI